MIQRRIVVLLLTLILALPATFALAQPPQSSSPQSDPPAPGMQASVWRTYGHPDAEVGRAMTPEAMATLTLRTIDVTITSFDSPEQAAHAFEQESALPFELQAQPGQNLVETDAEDMEGFGEQSSHRQRLAHSDFGTVVWESMIVQQETWLVTLVLRWQASYVDGIEPPTDMSVPEVIMPLASEIVGALPGDTTVRGPEVLWSMLPEAGDPELLGLVPWMDLQTYPPTAPTDATPQAPGEMRSPIDPATLAGIEAIGMRIYQQDGPGIGTAAYATDAPTFDPTARQDLALQATVYQFASAADAEAAFPLIADHGSFTAVDASQFTGSTTRMQADVPDLGEQARSDQVVITATGADWVRETTLEAVTVRDGNLVIVLESVSTQGPAADVDAEDTAASPVVELAAAMVAKDVPTATPAAFAPDGTSTGALWDRLPTAGDPRLQGLVPVIDAAILGGPEQ